MSKLTRVFGRYDKPIGLTFRKPHKLGSNINLLSQLTQLTQLDIGLEHGPIKLDQLTNLQSLTGRMPPFNCQSHSQLRALKTSNVPIVQPHVYPAHLEQLIVDSIGLPAKEFYSPDPKRCQKCFDAMPNIRHLELKESAPTFVPGIECQLTGLESLVTGTAVTGLPVNTMTALTVLAHQMYGHVNWDISHLTNLRRLAIVSRRFMNHTSLSPFKLLESLTIKDTVVDEHLTQLVGTQITQLEVSLANKHSLEHVTSLTNLRHLSIVIGYEDSIDLAQLTHLTQLTTLKVRGNSYWKHVENISECTKLKNLVELVLVQKKQMQGELLVLSSLTRLTRLTLKDQAPTIDITNMSNLQKLNVQHQHHDSANMTAIGLPTLHNLTSLTFSGNLTAQICSNLTALHDLTFIERVEDQSLEHACKLTRLTSLTGHTMGSGACLTRLTRLQRLMLITEEGSHKIRKELKEKLVYCHLFTYHYIDKNDETYQDDSDYDDE